MLEELWYRFAMWHKACGTVRREWGPKEERPGDDHSKAIVDPGSFNCHGVLMNVRGQLAGVHFLLLCAFW